MMINDKFEWSNDYIKNLLDNITYIVIVSRNGEKLITANQEFFNFFPKYQTLDAFNLEHTCICDFFEPCDDDGFIYKQKILNGMGWLDFVINSTNKIFKAKIIKNNKTFIFELKITILNKNINNIDYVISMNDITLLHEHQIKLEEKIKQEVYNRLEKEKFLIQQSKLASMGEMIGNIAHQWRQPLNTISIKLLGIEVDSQNRSLDFKYIQKFSKEINELVQYMSNTVNDFKDFLIKSKNKNYFYTDKLIDDVLTIISASLTKHKIKIITDKTNSLHIYGLENELKQVLLNIIVNAKDAIVLNGIKSGYVEISCKKIDDNIIFTIKDNGEGIPKDILNSIFEPYFTTKHKANGTGLGLYMSKMIIERNMNGKLKVENKNNGVVVTIIIKQKSK